MMNMFQGLLGNLGKQDPSSTEDSQPQMDEIFKQFTSFLKDQEGGEGDETFKGALDSVVKEIISKDSLYQPMKNLKEEYPTWLEDNWQSLNDEDLEKYNKQLDKVTEICELFENAEDKNQPKDEVFELLSQL
jgi:peroxin-19